MKTSEHTHTYLTKLSSFSSLIKKSYITNTKRFFILGGYAMYCRLFASKSTGEGQTLAREEHILSVQLSVGERNFILRENFR